MSSASIKKILVPTDFSVYSQEAIEYATSLAQTFKAQIFFLHVMELPASGLDFVLPGDRVAAEVKQKLAETTKQSIEKMSMLGIKAESYFIMGIPYTEIIEAARVHRVDLIVMGTHGRTGLTHFWLGSTAERVIQRAHCPVLTVKATTKQPLLVEKEKQARAILKDLPVDPGATFCHMCGRPSKDIICETCKIRVQVVRIEREGRTESGRH